MTTPDLAAIMERAIAAVGQPCYSSLTPANLLKADERGWVCIGAVWLGEDDAGWQVFWNPETGRGWLWALRRVPGGVVPRRFTGE